MADEEKATEPLFVADCGCTAYEVGEAFVFEPCQQPDCKIKRFVIEESRRQGKPVEYVEGLQL